MSALATPRMVLEPIGSDHGAELAIVMCDP
jgi:hypothetical protein